MGRTTTPQWPGPRRQEQGILRRHDNRGNPGDQLLTNRNRPLGQKGHRRPGRPNRLPHLGRETGHQRRRTLTTRHLPRRRPDHRTRMQHQLPKGRHLLPPRGPNQDLGLDDTRAESDVQLDTTAQTRGDRAERERAALHVG